ncbi:hypothetical protein V5799_032957, partial [Amblyomma americanum]
MNSAIVWPHSAAGILIVVLQGKLSVFVITLLVVGAASATVVAAAFCPNMACMSVTLGGIYGVAFGASLTSFAIYTLLYFDKYTATSTAMKYSAWSASGLAGPLIMSFFANLYGLHGALLLTSGLAMNALPLVMLLKDPRPFKVCTKNNILAEKRDSSVGRNGPAIIGKEQDDLRPTKPVSETVIVPPSASIDKLGLTLKGVAALFRIPDFYVLLVVYAVFDWTALLHSTTAVDYGRDKGVSLESAKYVLTCHAFGHLVGRSVVPFASDRIPFSHCPIAVASLFASFLSFIGASLVRSFTSFMALNVVLGVGQGFVTCIRSVLITNYLGVQRLPAFFGFLGLLLIPLASASATILAATMQLNLAYLPASALKRNAASGLTGVLPTLYPAVALRLPTAERGPTALKRQRKRPCKSSDTYRDCDRTVCPTLDYLFSSA